MELPAMPSGEEPPRLSPSLFFPASPLLSTEGGPLLPAPTGILLPNDSFSDGETTVYNMMSWYAEQAGHLLHDGAASLWLEGYNSLWHLRAALLGARETGLPTVAVVEMSDDGETRRGDDPLGCLLCLQKLGAAAFGLHAAEPGHLAGLFHRLLPYAGVPLIASADLADGLTPGEWAAGWRPLLDEGARLAAPGRGVDPEAAEALKRLLSGYHASTGIPPRPEDAPLLLTGGPEVHFLEEDFSLSDPIPCDSDLPEHVLTWEDEGVDVLLFEVGSLEEAEFFAQYIHMARNAVSVRSDDEALLEYCLLEYGGAALIDARSDLDETVVKRLAARYGAAIR